MYGINNFCDGFYADQRHLENQFLYVNANIKVRDVLRSGLLEHLGIIIIFRFELSYLPFRQFGSLYSIQEWKFS